jgi:hypothetical protein
MNSRIPAIQMTLDDWVLLAQRDLGLEHGPALRATSLEAVNGLLRTHAIETDAAHEVAAQTALRLALAICDLKPVRRWGPKDPHPLIGASTAIELLRLAGWSFEAVAVATLAASLERAEPQHHLLRDLFAFGATPTQTTLNAEVYVSVPVSNRTATMGRLLGRWMSIIEDELESVGREIGIGLFMRAPGMSSRSAAEFIRSVRSGMRHSVLHIVVGAAGGTPGIGMEIEGSVARRRPVIWLVPPGDRAPNSVVLASHEADISILTIESGIDHLRASLSSEVRQREAAIRRLLQENRQIPVVIMELQEELRRRFLKLGSAEPLVAAGIKPARTLLLLNDAFVLYHESSVSELDAFSSILGIDIFAARRYASRLDVRAESHGRANHAR